MSGGHRCSSRASCLYRVSPQLTTVSRNPLETVLLAHTNTHMPYSLFAFIFVQSFPAADKHQLRQSPGSPHDHGHAHEARGKRERLGSEHPVLCGEPEFVVSRHCASALALTASRSSTVAAKRQGVKIADCTVRSREQLVGPFLLVECFDRCRPSRVVT